MPKIYDINTITICPKLEDCLNGRDIKEKPFLWELEDAPNNLKKEPKKRYQNLKKAHSVKLPAKSKEWLLFSDRREFFCLQAFSCMVLSISL